MSVNLGLVTEANLSQHLNLAPQLLNWLKLLQVPTVELNQMIQNELLTNPALEEREPEMSAEDDWADSMAGDPEEFTPGESDVDDRLAQLAEIDDEWRTADEPLTLATSEHLQDQKNYMMDTLVRAPSLQEEIDQSIACSDLSVEKARLARELSGYLNDRGYLDISLEDFAAQEHIELDDAWALLLDFQALVPPGIGARDLQECLILQLASMRCDTCLAERIVHDSLDLLVEKDSDELCEIFECTAEELHVARDQIRMLDPDPGMAFLTMAVEYIEPDLEFRVEDGEVRVELCDDAARPLQISSYCKRLLQKGQGGSREDKNYIRRKLREASFIIQGISQRQDTMLKVGRQIARVQKEFFLKDDGQLQPLTMNKVAAIIGVHETTVSRAVANKFVKTPRGPVEMRAFFKVGYRCADGSSVTPEKIKEQLSELIDGEEAPGALTDAKLSALFKKKGVNVARRTIAKYREELGIPSSKARKSQAVC